MSIATIDGNHVHAGNQEQIVANLGLWISERGQLQVAIRNLRKWVCENQHRDPAPFGELATHLRDFNTLLRGHFTGAAEIFELMREKLWCIEVQSAKRAAESDHSHLLGRLAFLTAKIDATQPLFETNDEANDQLEWFFDELDQHEERQADSFEWLLHSECN